MLIKNHFFSSHMMPSQAFPAEQVVQESDQPNSPAWEEEELSDPDEEPNSSENEKTVSKIKTIERL